MERLRWPVVPFLFALAFLALHLPYLPRSLEDVDSINFALGIRDFDVAEHQPHPPGYPVFILAAKGVNRVVGSEARALALLGIVAGALSAFALAGLFPTIAGGRRPAEAVAAAFLTMTAPLFWITAARPLSDMTGLAAALFVQWLIVRATSPRALVVAAFLAGLGAGIRSQVAWLTVPLLALAVIRLPSSVRLTTAARSVGSYAGGVVLWAVPLVMLSGGPAAYWRAVRFQGSEDLSGVTMLWTEPTPRQLLAVFQYTFLEPWALWPIAAAVLALAAIGFVKLLLGARSAIWALAAAFAPYLLFNTLFQETVTTRYALPLVVPTAYLAVVGASAFARPIQASFGETGVRFARSFGVWLVAAVAGFNLAIAQSSLVAYALAEAPAFRLLAEMRAAQDDERAEKPVLAMHRREEFDLRRPFRWVGSAAPEFQARLPSPPKIEWLELVKYWTDGGRVPVWFVADPLRSDLALVHHGPPRRSYRWPLRFPRLIGGVRPNVMDWYELRMPAWYVGEGWALTPETAGIANETRRGPGRAPIEGWIHRTDRPATLMIGGRNFAGQGGPVKVRVALDGRTIEEFAVPPGFFLRFVGLPAGALAGSGGYATLAISAEAEQIAIEQFDAQPDGEPMFGFSEGWHEHEYNPRTGDNWRWTSDRATIRLRPEGRALTLVLRGESESPARSHVIVRAGDRVISDQTIDRSLSLNTRIPAATFAGEDGTIVIETDQAYVPAETRWRSQDRRRLGLKILECAITPAS